MEKPATVEVWDLPVRIFHWALVLLLISQVVTASIGGNAMDYHKLGGYAVLTLVLFRLLWGFFGGRHARFAAFVRGPRAAFSYARGLLKPSHAAVLGHNPLGGWSVLAMLASLAVQTVSGLFADDDIMTSGPLAKHVSDKTVSFFTAVHEANVFVLGVLIALHIAAIFYYLLRHRENLIAPMISGRKVWREPLQVTHSPAATLVRAAAILVVSGLAVAGLVNL
jgi:cytochrome b